MTRWMLLAILSFTLGGTVRDSAGEKFDLVKGYILVQAYVNDRGPFLLLVDTGAASSALTPAAARAAGMVPGYRVTLAAAGGESLVPAAGGTRIRVGAVFADGVEVLLLPLEAARGIDSRIQGVLGQSFLSRFPCLIDYRSGRLWLGEEAARRGEKLPERFPIDSAGGRMAIPVSIDSFNPLVRLVVDSGASDLMLTCDRRCPRLVDAGATARLLSNTGGRQVRQVQVAAVGIGGIRIEGPTIALLDGPPLTPLEDGVLPTRWFSAVYLDPGGKQVRVAR